jgi:hypothetical protein
LKGEGGDSKIRENFTIDGVTYAPSSLRTEGRTVKPSGYAEFDSLTGYVTGNYVSEWKDRCGTRWRTVVTVINLGRPDRGVVVDPDAQLADEFLYDDESQKAYAQSIVLNREERHEAAKERIVAYLQEHGPVPIEDLCAVGGWKKRPSVKEHLVRYPELYLCFWENPQVWGLHGQTYDPQGKARPVVMKMHDAIIEHGPMTAQEIADATGSSIGRVTGLLREGAPFVKVGERDSRYKGVVSVVWGLEE